MSVRRWTELTRALASKWVSTATAPLKKRDAKLEPLEQRALMALVSVHNEPLVVAANPEGIATSLIRSRPDASIATDNRGDFVVVWTKIESITDPITGDIAPDPVTGRVYESNIYARYFTDEVQRLVVPAGAVGGSIELLQDRGQVGQRLRILDAPVPRSVDSNGDGIPDSGTSIFVPQGTRPEPEFGGRSEFQQYVKGELIFGFDVDGDGQIADTEQFTLPVDNGADQSGIYQDILRTIPGLESATVEFVDRREYLFNITAARDQSGALRQLQLVDDSGLTGLFLPSAELTVVKQERPINDPVLRDSPIRVVAGATPQQTAVNTANQIRTAMRQQGLEVDVQGRYWAPTNELWFDITFKNSAGATDWSELTIVNVRDALGNSLGTSLDNNVVRVDTLKEPGTEFRVNDPEIANPFTGETRRYNQKNPSVAMDSDGDFVIVWQSEVPDDVTFRSGTDIFAKRFDSTGQALGAQQLVNEFTTNSQYNPNVSMNDSGNYVIVWAGEGQDDSFFNNIYARWFSDRGLPVGSSVIVEQNLPGAQNPIEVSETELEPEVALSPDGHAIVLWTGRAASAFELAGAVYDPARQRTAPRYSLRLMDNPNQYIGGTSAAFDDANRLIVAWNVSTPPNTKSLGSYTRNVINEQNLSVEFQEYRLVTSSDTAPKLGLQETGPRIVRYLDGAQPTYGFDLANPSVSRDADGDSVVTVSGTQDDFDFESALAPYDADLAIRNKLLPSYNQNSANEEQNIQLLTNGHGLSGDYRIFLGERDLGKFAYNKYESQVVVVYRPAELLEPTGFGFSIGKDSGFFTPTKQQTDDWGKLADGAARAAEESKFVLDSLNGFLKTTDYAGAAASVEIGDYNADQSLDYKFTITFKGNEMEDVPELSWIPGANFKVAKTDPNSSGFSYESDIATPFRIQRELQKTLARGNVTLDLKYADLNGDATKTAENKDLGLTFRWVEDAGRTNIPDVKIIIASDAKVEFTEVVRGFADQEALADQRALLESTVGSLYRGTSNDVFGFISDADRVLEGSGQERLNKLKGFTLGSAETAQNSVGHFVFSLQNGGDANYHSYERFHTNNNLFLGAGGNNAGPPPQPTLGIGTVADYNGSFFIYTDAQNVLEVPFPNIRGNGDWVNQLESNIANAIRGSGWYGAPFPSTADAKLLSPVAVRVVPPAEVESWTATPYEIIVDQSLGNDEYLDAFAPAGAPGRRAINTGSRGYDRALGDVVVEIVMLGAAKDQPAFFQVSPVDPRNVGNTTFLRAAMDAAQVPQGLDNVQFATNIVATASISWQQMGRSKNAATDVSVAMQPGGSFVASWTASAAGTYTEDLFFPETTEDPTTNRPRTTVFTNAAGVPSISGGFGERYLFRDLVNPLFGPGWGGAFVDSPDVLNDYDGNPRIVFNQIRETTDTAGPRVTDFAYGDGRQFGRLSQGDTINSSSVSSIVVSFDEDMAQEGLGSVTNVSNWELVKDGSVVRNGIRRVTYGLNVAADLGLGPRTNKYEAVVEFDGNGVRPNTTPLETGGYELIAKNAIRDRAGNPLGRRGPVLDQTDPFFNPGAINGAPQSRRFAIQASGSTETPVNGTVRGRQETGQANGQSVSTDQDGDFVVVWTSDGTQGSSVGLYATIYSGKNEAGPAVRVKEVLITSDPTAQNPAIARDGDGDFVVTWAQISSVADDEFDIYAQRFDALGNARGAQFRVNDYTLSSQNFPTVAMDAFGDFVIGWQSQDQESQEIFEGNGYGIYLKRYDAFGRVVGATQESQVLEFRDDPRSGTFRLEFRGELTAPITYTTNTLVTAQNIKKALEDLVGVTVVDVLPASRVRFVVTFSGFEGQANLPLMIPRQVSLSPTGRLLVLNALDGTTGETLVNETLEGDQISPAISMDASGAFVVSWTSLGQGGDAVFDGNIYAKRFVSNQDIVRTTNLRDALVNILDETPEEERKFDPTDRTPRYDDGHERSGPLDFNLGPTKWGAAELGTRATITYSFMAGGIPLDSSDSIALDTFMPAGYREEIRRAFRAWERVAGLRFIEVADPNDAFGSPAPNGPDIRITGEQIDGPSAVLAHAFLPPQPQGSTANGIFGDLHFDSDENWTLNGRGDGIDVFIVAAHEIGHTIGLLHTNVRGSLMEPFYNPALRGGPQPDDIAGAQVLYGPPRSGGGGGGGPEILVNTTTAGNQTDPSVALDANGDFVVAWTSYGNDGGGNGYGAGFGGRQGVFARRFDNIGAPVGNEFLVNTTVEGNQRKAKVSAAANGDFVVAWESFQEISAGQSVPDSYGVYVQRYASNERVAAFPGGRIGNETRVNKTGDGDQRGVSVGLDNEGNQVVVWYGPGSAGNDTDVYFSRDVGSTDKLGAQVTGVFAPAASGYQQVLPNSVLQILPDGKSNELYILFGENLLGGTAADQNSVLSLNNWEVVGGQGNRTSVASVEYGFNLRSTKGIGPASDTWEARIVLDGDARKIGTQPLQRGNYTLGISDLIHDVSRNRLDGDADGVSGGQFTMQFSVGLLPRDGGASVPEFPDDLPDPPGDPRVDPENPIYVDTPVNDVDGTAGPLNPGASDFDILLTQNKAAISMNAAGDYVMVWLHDNLTAVINTTVGTGGAQTFAAQRGVVAQRFNSFGQRLGGPFIVALEPAQTLAEAANGPPLGRISKPDVAMDSLGNFTVTWAGGDVDVRSDVFMPDEIWARQYDFSGAPLGDVVLVNQVTTSKQLDPSIAADERGDFVITWTSYDADGDRTGVFARRLNGFGELIGNDFRVNTYTRDYQQFSDVTIDDNGDVTVVWQSYGQDGSSWGVYGQRFNLENQKLGPEFRINQFSQNQQSRPRVASDSFGNFTVVWQSANGPLNTPSGYDVYARRFNAAGAPVGGEFRVNSLTNLWQFNPDVAMSGDGDSIITWTSQIGPVKNQVLTERDDGVYARVFNADGSDFIDRDTGAVLGDFRLHRKTDGDQFDPVAAMDRDGDMAVAWVGEHPSLTSVKVKFQTIDADVPTISEVYTRYMLVNSPEVSTIDFSNTNLSTGVPTPGNVVPGTWKNPTNRLDINNDGKVSNLDVLILVDKINDGGPADLGTPPPNGTVGQMFYDVDGNGRLTIVDVLGVVDYLNDRTEQLTKGVAAPPPAPVSTVAAKQSSASTLNDFALSSASVGVTLSQSSFATTGAVSDSLWSVFGVLDEEDER